MFPESLRRPRLFPALAIATLVTFATPAAVEEPTRDEAREALRRAIRFFSEQVAVEGGYVWRYSHDLARREGEGKLDHRTAWVQPPGTPYVGQGYLTVFELTGERTALDAARETTRALIRGQLHSGGWSDRIDFDPAERRKRAYLADGKPARRARDVSILDDDRTQSAIRFLVSYDRATDFMDREVGAAARRALDSLVAAQHRNGGWAQVYRGPAQDTGRDPSLRASYREQGEYPRVKAYWDFYTLNDNVMRDCIDTLLLAAEVYDERRYLDAARRGGDFLMLAQMPEPQPGWAQQYDHDMHPAWARKFEPPSISGNEGPAVMHALMDLVEATGDRRYLEPIPRALRYYMRSRLDDGRLARFYELKTNRPLYFDREYRVTYSDADVPTHYSFKARIDLEAIARRFERLKAKDDPKKPAGAKRSPSRPDARDVRRVIDALDERGAWVEDGTLRYWGKDDPTRRIIDPRTFVRNTELLARYVGR